MPSKQKYVASSDNADDVEKVYQMYFSLYSKYTSQYGEKMALLIQVGSFFEIYGEKRSTGEITNTNIETIGKICRIEIADKKVNTPHGTLVMAGFRDYALDKFVEILIHSGYTVVVYDQKPNPKLKGKMIREHFCTYSPGTFFSVSETPQTSVSNNVMCIWMEKMINKRQGQPKLICGLATAHIFSGETSMFEYEIEWSNCTTIYDELERYVSVFSPSEIIVISRLSESDTHRAEQLSGINTCPHLHRVFLSNKDNAQTMYALRCEKQVYVNQILESVYGVDAYRNCIEFREYSIATQSFCFLLNFLQEHNPDLIKKMAQPVFTNISTRMILANHTLQQLNILSATEKHNKKSSVFTLLDECKTSMGKRLYRHELTSPTTDPVQLETHYQNTANYLQLEEPVREKTREWLGAMIDLDKWTRQLVLRKTKPRTWIGLHRTLMNARYMLDNTENDVDACISFIETHIDLEKCSGIDSMSTFDTNFIRPGISQTLDELQHQYSVYETRWNRTHACLNNLIGETDFVKIHKTEKSGIRFQITSTRSELLKPAISNAKELQITSEYRISCGNIKFKKTASSSTMVEITSTEIDELIHHMHSTENERSEEIKRVYLEILQKTETEIYDLLEIVSSRISQLDMLQCRAFVANKYRLCRPTLYESDTSGFKIEGLRHILIEQIQTDEIYVENDLEMSTTETTSTGILLFGTNAVGKTSFIRALGVAMMMAQTGFYVSASSFHYCPYRAIYSRIWGNDNLFRGLSTFAVEMSELRVILNMADRRSLILGDELCSGTETESALSIFSAGLEALTSRGSTFLFATHFHEITSWEEIKAMRGLALKHMSVHYDREIDALVYDRKLKDGPGNRMYGLEVCKSLHLNDAFLERAYTYRRKYFDSVGGTLSYKQSQYNANKLRGICERCGQHIGEEIHHMIPQENADKNGFLHGGSVHKNHAANLASLCEPCHKLEHHPHTMADDGVSEISDYSTKSIRKKTTANKYTMAVAVAVK